MSMDAFAMSVIVSVDIQKKGALYRYPMGRDRCKPTN